MNTQIDICEWAAETFGPQGIEALAVRGKKEYEELIVKCKEKNPDFEAIAEEAADVLFFLYQISNLCGVDLEEEAKRKLNVNMKRTWGLTIDGDYQHLEKDQ